MAASEIDLLEPDDIDVGEIELEVPDRIISEPARYKRWRLMRMFLEKKIQAGEDFVTRALVHSSDLVRVTIAEILHDTIRNEENMAEGAPEPLTYQPNVRLATVDGRPLARAKRDKRGRIIPYAVGENAHMRGVKVGMAPLDARAIRRWKQQGREIETFKEYGADFEVPAKEAWELLARYGYRVRYPIYRARNTPQQRLRSPLFEVGGPFQAEVEGVFNWKDPRK